MDVPEIARTCGLDVASGGDTATGRCPTCGRLAWVEDGDVGCLGGCNWSAVLAVHLLARAA